MRRGKNRGAFSLTALTLVAFVACSDDEPPTAYDSPGRDASAPTRTDEGLDAPIVGCGAGECCVEGSLPQHGVRLVIRTADCNVVRGRTVHFDIGLEIKNNLDISARVRGPGGMGALGSSLETAAYDSPADVIGLKLEGSGAGDRYCLCDIGNTEPSYTDVQSVPVKATSHYYPFTWSGRSWGGPSDTAEPQGDYFAPGPAKLEIFFAVDDRSVLDLNLPFTITGEDGDAGVTTDAGATKDGAP